MKSIKEEAMSCITKIALNLCDSQFKRKEGIDVNLT